MASIRILPNRPCWLAVFTDANGSHYCRTTHIPHTPVAPPATTPTEVVALHERHRALAKEIGAVFQQAVREKSATETGDEVIRRLRIEACALLDSPRESSPLARRLADALQHAGQTSGVE